MSSEDVGLMNSPLPGTEGHKHEEQRSGHTYRSLAAILLGLPRESAASPNNPG